MPSIAEVARDSLAAPVERDQPRGHRLDPVVQRPEPGHREPHQVAEVSQEIDECPLVPLASFDPLGHVVETTEQVAIAHLAGVVVVRAHDRQPDHSGRPAVRQCREIDTPATEDTVNPPWRWAGGACAAGVCRVPGGFWLECALSIPPRLRDRGPIEGGDR
mgnify:CR=1 FL=1